MKQYALIFLFLFSACGHLFSQEISSDKKAAIDELLKAYEGQPGVAISVAKHGGESYVAGNGIANLDYDIPITEKSVFDLATMSMQLTAASIFLLEEEGKLSIEDPIQKYLPKFPVYENEIKIKHLIHHTSGIRSYHKLIFSKGESWNNNYDKKDIKDLLYFQKGVNFIPGEKHAYNNSNYFLLALIVESISGQSLGTYLKEKIFTPLGMKDTYVYDNTSLIIPNRVIGYASTDDGFAQEHYWNSTVTGDGNILSTAGDFQKWMQNYINPKVGGKSLVNKMLQVGTLNNGEETIYAGGLYIDVYKGLPSARHSGSWAGFNSVCILFPEQEVSFVVLSNQASFDPWGLLNQLTDIVLEETLSAQGTAAPVAGNQTENNEEYLPSSKEMSCREGAYFNYVNGYPRFIHFEEDALFYQRPGAGKNKLIPVGKDSYVFEVAPAISVVFSGKEKKGTMTVRVGNDTPFSLNKYIPKEYANKELEAYVGSYSSSELGVVYDINVENDQLCISIEDEAFLCLNAVMENVFNDEHFGYLKFEEDADGNISQFTINDELAKDILFTRMYF